MSESASRTGGRGGGGGASASNILASVTQTLMSAAAEASGSGGGKNSGAQNTTASQQGGQKGGKNNALKKLKSQQIERGVFYTWYVTTGVVFACFCVYAFAVVRAYFIRRRGAAARAAGAGAPPSKPSGSVAAAATAFYQNWAYVRVWPLWIYTFTNTSEIFWTAAYTGIVLGLGFWGSTVQGNLDYANPMGYVAFGQIPLIVGLAGRNNVLSWVTGISYEKLNYLHRASGRVCVLTVALHTFGWVKKGLGKHGPGSKIFLTGTLSAVALLLMFLTSFTLQRRIAYEFFLWTHIIMCIIFIVGAYYHWPRLGQWCYAGLVVWAFDRVAGWARMIWVNKAWLMPLSSRREEHSSCVAELTTPDVIRLRVKRPNLKWHAGQHAFITMPGVATTRYEQHPFTIGNVPDASGEAFFIIRAQSGFTRKLVDRLSADIDTSINCYLDGPYGLGHDMNHYSGVVLVCGGTGITFGTSHLMSILAAARQGRSAVSFVRLVWNVRDAGHVTWVAPLLNAAVEHGTGNTRVSVDVFVTQSSASASPNSTESAACDGKPIETPMMSPNGSSDNFHEKNSDTSSSDGSEHKVALAAGLSTAASGVVSFHRGRSNIEMILREDVAAAPADAAGVALGVCGPTPLALDARRAVCQVNSASAVLRGQNPVTFYSETFGW